jgi:hypothetical protein
MRERSVGPPDITEKVAVILLQERIAELEAALRAVVDAWGTPGAYGAPGVGLDPMGPAIDNAEAVLRKSDKR